MTEEEALEQIIKAGEVLGWTTAVVPAGEPNEEIAWLLMGKPEALKEVLNGDFSDYATDL